MAYIGFGFGDRTTFGWKQSANSGDGFDGWTEAWMRDDLNVAKLRELIEMLHNEEALQRPV